MKRVGQWMIGIGIAASTGFLIAGPETAAQESGGCSLETLRGQYIVAATGALFPPAFGVTQQSVSTVAGYSIYNGDGTGTDHVTQTVNGIDQHVPSPVPTTYTLNSDCAGTKQVLNGPSFNIFVAIDGSELAQVSTTPGFAVAVSSERVKRTR
jgi:hypothetical protein